MLLHFFQTPKIPGTFSDFLIQLEATTIEYTMSNVEWYSRPPHAAPRPNAAAAAAAALLLYRGTCAAVHPKAAYEDTIKDTDSHCVIVRRANLKGGQSFVSCTPFLV